MIKNKLISKIATFIFLLVFAGCSEDWDEHYKVNDNALEQNIIELIKQKSNLSEFYQYLNKTGLNRELASSKSFSVWAPENGAFAQVPASTLNDSAKLNQLISYYISLTGEDNNSESYKLKMMNGKYVTVDGSNIEDASVKTGEKYICRNGIIHVVDKAYIPKPNTWEDYETSAATSAQKAFTDRLYDSLFNEELSQIIDFNILTGQPIYDTVRTWNNLYLTDVASMDNEDSSYTFIVLSDEAFNNAVNMYSSYYYIVNDTTDVIKDSLAMYNICLDMMIAGVSDNETGTFLSMTGETLNIESGFIDSVRLTSNGRIYFLNTFPIDETDKFGGFKIEGEMIHRGSEHNWIIRPVTEASESYDFYFDHGTNNAWAQYTLELPYPGTFRFYMKAVISDDSIGYQSVELFNYDPVEKDLPLKVFNGVDNPFPTSLSYIETENDSVGNYTFTGPEIYYTLRVFARQNPAISGKLDILAPIVVDYIKVVPLKNQ